MCAIIGAVGTIPEEQTCIHARDTMLHRGPDDAGIYYHPEEGVFLGHRRLSIIDLSSAGHQPFVSHDGRYILTFNGEIYNYQALKEILKGTYPFTTETDTEVLLAAYMRWGIDCLKHLQGMFAFAVWDRQTRQLCIARDRLGIKPLFYTVQDGTIYFASEMKGLLAFPNVPRKLYTPGVLDYLSYRFVLGDKTFFEGIYNLLPGHYLIINETKQVKPMPYWTLPVVTEKPDPGENQVFETAKKLLTDTVRSHMMSDVSLGAYLSGGLDSSVVVALMASLSSSPVKTFSIGFEEEGFNEFSYARLVADAFHTDHHEIILQSSEYLDKLPEVIRFKDAPLSIPNEVAVHALSKELKKYISVVLSGEGADELFAGYGRIFRSSYDLERMQKLTDPSYLSSEERVGLIKNLEKKYGSVQPKTIMNHFLDQYTYFPLAEKQMLLHKNLFHHSRETLLNEPYFTSVFGSFQELPPTEQYLAIFQTVHILGPLHRLDATTMSESVEARVPFVDHALVEYISSLPLSYKMRWKSAEAEHAARLLNSDEISETYDTTKYLLREIGKELLPKDIIERKKLGFPVPLNRWFSHEFKTTAKEVLSSGNARTRPLFDQTVLADWLETPDRSAAATSRHGMNIWMLYNLELWMNEYAITI